ncbi:sigma factor-like helix-turn-helix DNA-binding protein [Nocardia noduli]|uniref:sigma factor-like helix-turn-helix DNA-binding protein n=1 Tax=Nocardia noduli TaxID=2815722 RepID=UPI001C233E56|nr:sigma factor-like helix-turn-helix DNA-binding protein [Nocardia noduli]
MTSDDEFDAIRNDPDPIRRGRRAGELITVYQQRTTELSRLRKAAIEQAHREHGLSYSEIGTKLGLTKGRISQIRVSAPPPERAFYGVGPIAIGVPRRIGVEEGRERSYVDSNDAATRTRLERALEELSFKTTQFDIHPTTEDTPTGDCIIVCGPASAPVARNLLATDPLLAFDRTDQGWSIIDIREGAKHFSPYRTDGTHRDIGYLSRRVDGNRVIVHIAGITAIGSDGVAHWLTNNLRTVYDPDAALTDCIIECAFTEERAITDSRLLIGPYAVTR